MEELSHLAERDRSEEEASDKAPDRKSRQRRKYKLRWVMCALMVTP